MLAAIETYTHISMVFRDILQNKNVRNFYFNEVSALKPLRNSNRICKRKQQKKEQNKSKKKKKGKTVNFYDYFERILNKTFYLT